MSRHGLQAGWRIMPIAASIWAIAAPKNCCSGGSDELSARPIANKMESYLPTLGWGISGHSQTVQETRRITIVAVGLLTD